MPGRFIFVSSLPRSGSTLLMNLLGQNPKHHVTPTSGLIELFRDVKNKWLDVTEFKAEGLERVKPRVLSAMNGLLQGYFADELAADKTVFEKSRGWIQYIEPLEESLCQPVKVVATIRDIRAIVASFEKLYRRRSIDFRERRGDEFFNQQTVEGRARALLSPKSVVGISINRFRDAFNRGVGDRLVVISYEALTMSTQKALTALHEALELPSYEYDPENVEQITHENDIYHGMDLHRVRSRVETPEPQPWVGVLPPDLCDWIAEEYADVNQLCL